MCCMKHAKVVKKRFNSSRTVCWRAFRSFDTQVETAKTKIFVRRVTWSTVDLPCRKPACSQVQRFYNAVTMEIVSCGIAVLRVSWFRFSCIH